MWSRVQTAADVCSGVSFIHSTVMVLFFFFQNRNFKIWVDQRICCFEHCNKNGGLMSLGLSKQNYNECRKWNECIFFSNASNKTIWRSKPKKLVYITLYAIQWLSIYSYMKPPIPLEPLPMHYTFLKHKLCVCVLLTTLPSQLIDHKLYIL